MKLGSFYPETSAVREREGKSRTERKEKKRKRKKREKVRRRRRRKVPVGFSSWSKKKSTLRLGFFDFSIFKSRVDDSINQTVQNPRHRNNAANDPHADRLAKTLEALLQRQQNIDRFNIERANRLGVRAFNGKGDPLDADNWMTQLERVFNVMECPKEKKLRLATFLLEEAAYDWWLTVQDRYVDPSVFTWADFNDVFNKSYYPQAYKDAKQDEFLHLVQGSMIVVEYQRWFMELSKYAALLITNEADMCRRFKGGMRRDIRVTMIGGDYKDFGKLVEAALRVEQCILDTPGHKE
ncbi:Retrotrans gag domain-containing protein [Abeliophyllum distichum]|uniref:Retrotrans gag domain-containing protein n=1 Tax=Abeliophyllum distichum TaxID=126358 RepID=A0ABD1TJV7_9LAMI